MGKSGASRHAVAAEVVRDPVQAQAAVQLGPVPADDSGRAALVAVGFALSVYFVNFRVCEFRTAES